MCCNMSNEGWIYIGWDSKDKEYVKIGRGDTRVRGHCPQNPDYGIEFAIKVDNYKETERIIQNLFKRKLFRKSKNESEFCKTTLKQVFPLFLILANDVKIEDEKRGQTFIRVAEMVENKLEQYKKIAKPFVVNKINKLLKEGGVPVEDFYVEEETPKEKIEQKNQPTPQNRVCKYETLHKNTSGINWNLFFEDHKELVGKKVCFKNGKKDKMVEKYFAKLIKLKNGDYGVFFEGEEMSFTKYSTQLYLASHPDFNHSVQGTYHTYFVETGKNLLDTYNELKFK